MVTAKPVGEIIVEPGTPPDVARELKEVMEKVQEHSKTKQSITVGDPPILWSAVFRLPDGAVNADEAGGRDSVGFLLRPEAQAGYIRVAFVFQGARIERMTAYDVTDAQLRRWKASAWWPKEWR